MNKFRHVDEIHKFFAGASVGAFLAGIGSAVKANEIDFECVYLAIICMIIRFKFWIDDREYFLEVEKGIHPNNIGFKTGVIVGIISWMPWIVAGLVVGQEQKCAAIMVSVFIISMLWIICTTIDKNLSLSQKKWIYFNGIYTLLFFTLAARKAHWIVPIAHSQIFILMVETIILLIAVVDAYTSGTLTAVSKFTEPGSKQH